MKIHKFKIFADAAEITAEATPSMEEALGEQPWHVHLYDNDGLRLCDTAIAVYSTCAHDAAMSAAKAWMKSQGLLADIYKITPIYT